MNTEKDIARALDAEQVQRLLAMNGMSYAPAKTRHTHRSLLCYSLLVYDLTVLDIKRRLPGTQTAFKPIVFSKQTRMNKLLCRTAIRAVYCLGLSLATVVVGVHAEQPGFIVISIQPQPLLNGRQRMLLTEAMIRMSEQEQQARQDRAVIGMDLEFILCRADGKVVSAAQFVRRHGRVGYDGIRVKNKTVYPIVELRPSPRIKPGEVYGQLRQTMREAMIRIKDPTLHWVAGGMPKQGFRLGGHIHLSKIFLSARLLRTLDNYLALPFLLLEGESAHRRRPRYGFLGDYRHQFHGGFEYRTLPSWIVTPAVAKGVIALVRLIADHYPELSRTPLKEEQVQRFYYAGAKEQLLPYVRQLWYDLEHTSSYQLYAYDLDVFKREVLAMKAINETADIRRIWQTQS